MGKPRKTGNPLFDIVLAEWSPRITNAGVWEKRKKGPARKKFELINPTEEEAYDMVAWIRKDKECREKAKASNSFYTPPSDLIVFLNNESWEDEIGIEITKTTRREAHRSKAVYGNNIKSLIEHWQGVIKEWPDDRLRASKSFQAAWKYPEFRDWVKKERQGRKPDKADNPPSPPPIKPKKPDTTADLPPPRTENDLLVAQFVKDYNLFGK
jgi:hypothetical protein